jgi:hypothetical protein
MLKEISVKALMVIVAALLCLNIIIGCSGDGSKTQSVSKTQSSSETQTQMKPSEVVTAAYMAANEERYSEVEKYLSSKAKAAVNKAGEVVGNMKDVWDRKNRNGTIETIEIIREDVKGDKATIAIRIHFNDRSISDQHESIIKEGGQWKMTLQ